MKNLYFDDFEEFLCQVDNHFNTIKELDIDNDVAIVAKHNEAKEIIKKLICIGYELESIEIYNSTDDGYNAEYIISLYDNEIFCEPMLRENGYFEDESTIIYILDNCSSKVIPYCKGKTVYEVTVGEDDSEDEEYTINGKPVTKEEFDEYVSQFKKFDEKPATTTTSSTTYKVNGKECDKETYEKALNELDEKYLDNVQDMLLNYFDFVSEMNQWRRLLW